MFNGLRKDLVNGENRTDFAAVRAERWKTEELMGEQAGLRMYSVGFCQLHMSTIYNMH